LRLIKKIFKISILIDHKIAAIEDAEVINSNQIATITSKDWGWYTTIIDNLKNVTQFAKENEASLPVRDVQEKIWQMEALLENSPKSISWKLRAKIGRKIKWYNEPEEKEI
jgi:hypothetical protein